MSAPIDPTRLADLRARFAAVGCELIQPPPTDSRAPLFARFGATTRVFGSLEDAGAFLAKVGGQAVAQDIWRSVATPADAASDLKAWATLRAQLALHKVQAFRSDPADGPRSYFTISNGVAKSYPDQAALRARLEDLEGGSL